MSFLYPTFLWALTAVLIPVIIHLFSFRRHKTVYFSQTRFLETVRNDNRSRSKLKHLLILLIRMLMIAALALAFAGPVIRDRENSAGMEKHPYIAVYVDNSFSMMNEGENGNLLDEAKQYALDIAEAYGSDYKYILLSNSMPASHFRPMSKDVFMTECGKLEYSSSSRHLSEICTRAQSLFASLPDAGESFPVYLISDFQRYISDFKNLQAFSSFDISIIRLNPVLQQNLSIDSVWFDKPFRRPDQAEQLFVSIKNHGDNVYTDVPVRLSINDSLKAVTAINLEEDQATVVGINYTNARDGIQRAKLEIDDYPMSFDNEFYFSYLLKSQQKILVIEGNKVKSFPKNLFSDYPELDVDYQSFDQLDLSVLSGYDVVVINAVSQFTQGLQMQITNYLSDSGVLWLIPDETADISSWNHFLASQNAPRLKQWSKEDRELDKIAGEHYFFKSVFPEIRQDVKLPVIHGSWTLSSQSSDMSEDLIEFKDGGGFFVLVETGESFVYLLSSPIHKSYGDFYRHPLLIPVAWNLALNIPDESALYYYCGEGGSVEIRDVDFGRESGMEIRGNDISLIPTWRYTGEKSARIFIPEILDQSGFYDILQDDNFMTGISLNARSQESEPEYMDTGEIESSISAYGLKASFIKTDNKAFKDSVISIGIGKKLAFWFLLSALVFLIAEILIVRLVKE